MIRLFRHIRKDLMEHSKTIRYLKYGLGEVFLVVLGILIALQVNNWNEDRIDRKEEQALLSQLHAEYESNLDQLDEKISIRNEMITASFKLLEYAESPDKIERDSIFNVLNWTILLPTFDPIVNDINSSGRIQLLKNTRLKELLALWTSEVIEVKEEERRWNDYNLRYYTPFIIEETSYRNILDAYWENNTIEAFHLDKGMKVRFEIGESSHILDASQILKHPDLEDHLAFCITMAKVANTQSESLRTRIVEILDLIAQDLNR